MGATVICHAEERLSPRQPRTGQLSAEEDDRTGNPDVAVTSETGDNVETDVLPLPDYRRVSLGLAQVALHGAGVVRRHSSGNEAQERLGTFGSSQSASHPAR